MQLNSNYQNQSPSFKALKISPLIKTKELEFAIPALKKLAENVDITVIPFKKSSPLSNIFIVTNGFKIIVSDIEKPTTWLDRIKRVFKKPLSAKGIVSPYRYSSVFSASDYIVRIAQRTKDEFLNLKHGNVNGTVSELRKKSSG